MAGTNNKIGGGGFHHVSIHAKDFDASMKFYVDGLGFVEKKRWVKDNCPTVLLDTGDGNFMEISAGGAEKADPQGAFGHIAFRTDDCKLAIEQARSAGAEVTMELTEIELEAKPENLKVRIAFCKGPDGELIEFFEEL